MPGNYGKPGKYKKISPAFLCLIFLLLIQGLLMCYFAFQKAGFFIDEICTYEAANYGDAPEGTNGLIWHNTMEQWYDGSFFTDAITANAEKKFDFSIAYRNQSNDVHPPLYLMMIHLISSLFPGILSKWIGIAPNIFFNCLTTLILFYLAQNLYDDRKLALIAVAFWCLSVGCMTSTVFIRMYALMTLECVLFVWYHYRFFDGLVGKISVKNFVSLFFCTLLGTLTQYYFLIFAFFFCGIFTLYLLYKDKMLALKYAACEFGGVFFAGLLFPKMWVHLVSSDRGVEALSNLTDAVHMFEKLKTVCGIICANLLGGKLFIILLVCILLTLIITFINRNMMHCSIKKEANGYLLQSNVCLNKNMKLYVYSKSIFYWMIAFTLVMYLFVVARVAPYQTDRYYMCLYPFVVLLAVGFLFKALRYIIHNNKIIVYGSCAILCVVLCVCDYIVQPVEYLYTESLERVKSVSSYSNYPAIFINGLGFDAATDVYVFEYQHNKAVYRCRFGDYSGLANAANTYDLSDGFLLYAYWQRETGLSDEDIIARVNQYLPIAEYDLISDVGCRVFFCVPVDDI